MTYPITAAMTTDGRVLTNEQYADFLAKHQADLRKAEYDQKQEVWTRERREFWKAVCMNMLTASVVRMGSDLDLIEVKKAAKQALTWFDEEFGNDYPIDVETVFIK